MLDLRIPRRLSLRQCRRSLLDHGLIHRVDSLALSSALLRVEGLVVLSRNLGSSLDRSLPFDIRFLYEFDVKLLGCCVWLQRSFPRNSLRGRYLVLLKKFLRTVLI